MSEKHEDLIATLGGASVQRHGDRIISLLDSGFDVSSAVPCCTYLDAVVFTLAKIIKPQPNENDFSCLVRVIEQSDRIHAYHGKVWLQSSLPFNQVMRAMRDFLLQPDEVDNLCLKAVKLNHKSLFDWYSQLGERNLFLDVSERESQIRAIFAIKDPSVGANNLSSKVVVVVTTFGMTFSMETDDGANFTYPFIASTVMSEMIARRMDFSMSEMIDHLSSRAIGMLSDAMSRKPLYRVPSAPRHVNGSKPSMIHSKFNVLAI